MILIVGGQAAGKKSYARQRFGLAAQSLTPEQALHAPLVADLQDLICQLLETGQDVVAYIAQLMAENPQAVILCDEVGQGIVPLDRAQRAYREAVGCACCRLAAASDEVIRLVCGLPQRIK